MTASYKKVLWTLAILIVGVLLSVKQEPISLNQGLGWDGRHYAHMTQQVFEGQTISYRPPWLNRYGTIFLAASMSKTGLTIKESWQVINWIATALIFLTLVIIGLNTAISIPWFVLLLAWWCLHWLGPLRFTAFDPYSADNLAVLAVLLHFATRAITDSRIRLVLQLLVLFCGALCREFVCLVPLAFLLADWFELRRVKMQSILYLGASLTGYFTARSLVDNTMTTGLMSGLWYHFKDVTYHFTEIGLQIYALSWVIVFAPLLALLLLVKHPVLKIEHLKQPLPLAIILIWLFGWLGGTDIERYLFWSVPLVIVQVWDLLGSERLHFNWSVNGLLFSGLLSLFSALNGRWFMPIPEPMQTSGFSWPILTAFGGQNPYLMLFMWHAKQLNYLYFIAYLACYTLILALLWYFRPRFKPDTDLSHQIN